MPYVLPDTSIIYDPDVLENLGPQVPNLEEVHMMARMVLKGAICKCASCRGWADSVVKEPKRVVHLIPTGPLTTPGTIWSKDPQGEWHQVGPDEDDGDLQLA